MTVGGKLLANQKEELVTAKQREVGNLHPSYLLHMHAGMTPKGCNTHDELRIL